MRPGARAGTSAFTLVELLVTMSIILVLAGMLTGAIFTIQKMSKKRAASVDIKSIGIGMSAYFRDHGQYPDDSKFPTGVGPGSYTSEEVQANECMVYYLGTVLKKGLNRYGPYVEFKESKLDDTDGDGLKEYLDPFGNHYLYAENRSSKTPVGHNPKSYDLVSPGPDGLLGGSFDISGGYSEADEANESYEADNITNWSD